VSLALDDFGAGFSSLSRLARMPIDVLKLDRTFAAQPGEPVELSLVRGVVALARSLDLLTVAEGVETWDQVRELQEIGCQRAQGYLFARPMSGEAYAGLLGDALVAPTLPAAAAGHGAGGHENLEASQQKNVLSFPAASAA
jgi:EAL domain-containing protein (putative c-di-GMP-specific phosphodiesterase class I)